MDNSVGLTEVTLRQSTLVKEESGFQYRDLNKNGKLDIYEDPRQPIHARVEDLLSQMTLEEKAGMLFINGSVVAEDGSIEGGSFEKNPEPPLTAKNQMVEQKMNHFNLWLCRTQKPFLFGTTKSNVLLKKHVWVSRLQSLPTHAIILATLFMISSLKTSHSGVASWVWLR